MTSLGQAGRSKLGKTIEVVPPSSSAPPALCVTEHRNEAALLARLRAGDAAAFDQLVSTYSGQMLAVALRLLRHEVDALDAVQDAFLSTFGALDGFRGNARLSTWLHRLVVNKAIMHLRARKRHPEESIDELLPQFLADGHHAQPVTAWTDTVEVALQRLETRTLVRACIDRLPETYRTVLLLRDIEELTTEETAQLLDVPPSMVKIRLHRARLALQSLLTPHVQQHRG